MCLAIRLDLKDGSEEVRKRILQHVKKMSSRPCSAKKVRLSSNKRSVRGHHSIVLMDIYDDTYEVSPSCSSRIPSNILRKEVHKCIYLHIT